jgi:UDP-2,4-diacetamido-2,4,6-trideoxy-beta-L-altropyranose hydrolase
MSDAIPGPLVVRADAGVMRGSGHVMRCLAIAQAWQDAGGDSVFALHDDAAVGQRLRSEGMGVHVIRAEPGSEEDASQLIALARAKNAAWVIVDGYCFDEVYQLTLKQSGSNLLLLDDSGQAEQYHADIILNHNPEGQSITYARREACTRLLLGPEFALLRREFKLAHQSEIEVPSVAQRLLVTMGGSDEANVTERVMRALPLLQVDGLEATVVIGGRNPHKDRLCRTIESLDTTVKLVENIPNMPELMVSADLAITAGGVTCYELAFLRVPMFLITMAQNHERTCQVLAERGAAIHAGWFHSLDCDQLAAALNAIMVDPDRRKSLAGNARNLVDGEGASRVVASMRNS